MYRPCELTPASVLQLTVAEINNSFSAIMGLSYDKGHLERARPILGQCVC